MNFTNNLNSSNHMLPPNPLPCPIADQRNIPCQPRNPVILLPHLRTRHNTLPNLNHHWYLIGNNPLLVVIQTDWYHLMCMNRLLKSLLVIHLNVDRNRSLVRLCYLKTDLCLNFCLYLFRLVARVFEQKII